MNKNLKQIFSIMNSINEAIAYLGENDISQNTVLLDDIATAVDSCNNYMISNDAVALKLPDSEAVILCVDRLKNGEECLIELSDLFDIWFEDALHFLMSDRQDTSPCQKINTYRASKYGIDQEFKSYVNNIKRASISDLCSFAMDNLKDIKQKDENFYKKLTVDYRGWYFPGNWLDGIGGENNSLITNRMTVLKEKIGNFEWLFDRLCDYRSRATLNAIINNWLTFSTEALKKVGEGTFSFDPDILKCGKNEVYVDAGAYIGDTVADFVNTFGREYKRIYTYEISRETVEILKKNLASLDNVINNWKGISDKRGIMNLSGINAPFHGNKLGDSGLYAVEVVTLDEDITEPVTFIKIDVEGVDKEAICGAEGHIRNEHPKLAVDCYHKLSDIVEVPMLINKIDSTYKFYLRQPASSVLFATGYCIYAV